MFKSISAVALSVLVCFSAIADTVTIPFGTVVFCELDEEVTSRIKKDGTEKGDVVRAHVWKDVWIEDHLVIQAGTPVFVRVSEVKKAKMAGRKGKLELEALNVQAVNGRDVPLDGGYDKSGRGRMGLSIALAAVVAWPLIFLKGKHAKLEPGTIFDAMVRAPIDVEVEGQRSAPKIKLGSSLNVTILYDNMDPNTKIKELPLLIESTSPISSATVVSVNGNGIPALAVRIGNRTQEGAYNGFVDFKALSKHFTQGMNRFVIEAVGEETEVLLEIEF